MAFVLSNEKFEEAFTRALREQLEEVGAKALEEFKAKLEERLRAQLMHCLGGVIKNDYSLERQGNVISIRVNLGGGK